MSRYYEDRFSPYNRHDTGMYLIHRKSDGKYLGTAMNCKSEYHAERIAIVKYGCEVQVSLIEE
jgi:hypothetical protein